MMCEDGAGMAARLNGPLPAETDDAGITKGDELIINNE